MDDFESMFDEETLNEPVYEEDIDESYGETLNNAMLDVRLLFARVRRQYQGDTWISQELWEQYCLLDQAADRMINLMNQGVFKRPKPPTVPGPGT
jgi:hypothetical protein